MHWTLTSLPSCPRPGRTHLDALRDVHHVLDRERVQVKPGGLTGVPPGFQQVFAQAAATGSSGYHPRLSRNTVGVTPCLSPQHPPNRASPVRQLQDELPGDALDVDPPHLGPRRPRAVEQRRQLGVAGAGDDVNRLPGGGWGVGGGVGWGGGTGRAQETQRMGQRWLLSRALCCCVGDAAPSCRAQSGTQSATQSAAQPAAARSPRVVNK
jgi:hypothetical protein